FISAFGDAKARRDWRWIKSAFKNVTFASVALGAPLAALLALVSQPLILIWAGPSAVPDPHLVFWLFVYSGVAVTLMTGGQFLSGIERIDTVLLSIVLCALGCIVLGILFASWWGLSGIGFAMAVSILVVMSPIQVYEVQRIFRAASAVSLASEPQGASYHP